MRDVEGMGMRYMGNLRDEGCRRYGNEVYGESEG